MHCPPPFPECPQQAEYVGVHSSNEPVPQLWVEGSVKPLNSAGGLIHIFWLNVLSLVVWSWESFHVFACYSACVK